MAKETWTDERLGDLAVGIDKRFEQVDKRFEQVDKRFEQVDKRFEQVDRRFEQIDKRFEEVKGEIRDLRIEISGMQRTMIIGFATIAASTVASVIAAALVV